MDNLLNAEHYREEDDGEEIDDLRLLEYGEEEDNGGKEPEDNEDEVDDLRLLEYGEEEDGRGKEPEDDEYETDDLRLLEYGEEEDDGGKEPEDDDGDESYENTGDEDDEEEYNMLINDQTSDDEDDQSADFLLQDESEAAQSVAPVRSSAKQHHRNAPNNGEDASQDDEDESNEGSDDDADAARPKKKFKTADQRGKNPRYLPGWDSDRDTETRLTHKRGRWHHVTSVSPEKLQAFKDNPAWRALSKSDRRLMEELGKQIALRYVEMKDCPYHDCEFSRKHIELLHYVASNHRGPILPRLLGPHKRSCPRCGVELWCSHFGDGHVKLDMNHLIRYRFFGLCPTSKDQHITHRATASWQYHLHSAGSLLSATTSRSLMVERKFYSLLQKHVDEDELQHYFRE
ncbi:uncharacterized protein MYCGRDRAFT_111257 [Zymoseptoria tritici IPO323]|uniref:Uncharacterized protein n=1 Tax=Zymoseptoria tritici (strain CBS 115943 / IPO323) TaxID=336722 RepID=F9XN16_ZYMTI|nr:uncharacterized protein MYCGRDRAFT_111257 [Zymoseptoria tritici IPO323]EGP83593.1 hypothetical protein MYCGRDRAFT_111257 [Zymoseptoria tritici IPO323]